MELTEAGAFSALRDLIAGESSGVDWQASAHPAFERCRRAFIASISQRMTMADAAPLVRHALRYEASRRDPQLPPADLKIRVDSALSREDWARHGFVTVSDGQWLRVRALAWKPVWLDVNPDGSVDTWACSERVCRSFANELSEDPVLRAVKLSAYRSHLQRKAVWAALRMPPASTLLITLATGEGKSLVPYTVAKVGFEMASGPSASSGVTVVVVPTITLAQDQEKAAHERGFEGPLAYRAGRVVSNAALKERIVEGSQTLIFASPEAICGPLRRSLEQCASLGHLRALVVDEAHLVDSWGTGFRTEFQLVGGLRRELIRRAPARAQLRTILLTATLTSASRETLRTLFSEEGNFRALDAAALRPEPEYWVARSSPTLDRKERVLEAIRHLPRPMILYVTKVADAIEWGESLRQIGHQRLRVVHGKTPDADRDETLDRWRNADIDIVVATSAFGVGIDYAHVRSVVHACLPESLDRFYQEVGRGGRDGRTCLSLLVPAHEDEAIARRIAGAKVIGIERGMQRWHSMFHRGAPGDVPGTFDVRLNVPPGTDEEDIDMVGERSTDWSARTLALMERAGLLKLLGGDVRGETADPWQRVRIQNQEHLTHAAWAKWVAPMRAAIASASDRNLAKMLEYARDTSCVNACVTDLYGVSQVGTGCSSCKHCRSTTEARRPFVPASVQFQWPPVKIDPSMLELLDSKHRLVVMYDGNEASPRMKRRMGEALSALGRSGFLNLWLLGDRAIWDDVLPKLPMGPWSLYRGQRIVPGRLAPGPDIVLGSDGLELTAANLAERSSGSERVFLIPKGTMAPDRPEMALRQRHAGRMIEFDEFHRRLMR